MKEPFKVSHPLKWAEVKDPYSGEPVWLLVCLDKLSQAGGCDCGCNDGKRYGSAVFNDGSTKLEIENTKNAFSKYMRAHGVVITKGLGYEPSRADRTKTRCRIKRQMA